MDLIFRVEHRECGKGPYHGPKGTSGARQSYQSSLHPAPRREDGIDFRQGTHIFGFQSQDLARRWWFDVEDLEDFTKQGYRLLIWPARASDEILIGDTQCAFGRPACDPISLPAEAIHKVSKAIIQQMAEDKWSLEPVAAN